jgi:hypothetical protein
MLTESCTAQVIGYIVNSEDLVLINMIHRMSVVLSCSSSKNA